MYQITAVTISAQVRVVLTSAVVDRRKPVMPIRLPQMLLRNRVQIKGNQ